MNKEFKNLSIDCLTEEQRKHHEKVVNSPIRIMQVGEGNFLMSFFDWMVYQAIKAGKYDKNLELQTRTLLNITYTPDFVINKNNYKIYFDVKGKENDVYPIKKKMFLKTLEERNDGINYLFFEPHNIRQMLQAIEIIKKL